jgi:molecular chaperone GrpE (heat shock protein)
MVINFSKWLSLLANILALVIFMPGIALAIPLPNSSVILTQSSQAASYLGSYPEADFTPQERQQLQALRQRRNKEIKGILNSSQGDKLKEMLQAGDNINQALESLDLHPDQQSMIKAVMQLTNLKMKGILARHSLQIGQ